MKNKVTFACLAALTIAALLSAPTYTRSAARVISFVGMPAYDAGGNVTSVNVHAGVVQLLVNDADSSDVRGRENLISVDFDALGAGIASANITAAGKTITYTQWAALTRQMVLDRASAGGISQNGVSKINAGALAKEP